MSGRTYVGSSQDLRKRIMDYFDNNNLKNPKGSIIYKALFKYGHNNFNLKILEYCSIKDLMVREQYYLDNIKPDYNILTFAGSSRGYRHTEASKELMRLVRNEWNFTPDQLANFSSNSIRNKPTTLTGEINTFFSMKNAAEFLGITVTTLRSYLNNNLSYNEYIISHNSELASQDNEVKEFSSKPQSIMLTNIKDSGIIKEELAPPTIKDAAKFLDITRSSLSYILNNSQNIKGGLSGAAVNGYLISRAEKSLNYIKPNSKSIEVTDLKNNTTNNYSSVTSAADALGVAKGSISMYFSGKQFTPYKNRYILKKVS